MPQPNGPSHPNIVNIHAPRKLARLYSRRVATDCGRKWFEGRLVKWLRRNLDCAVRITEITDEDRMSLPEWAIEAWDKGVPIHYFHATKEVVAQLQKADRYVRSLEKVAETGIPSHFLHEAKTRLTSLQHYDLPEVLKRSEEWFKKLDPDPDYDKLKNKKIFSSRGISSVKNRKWKRITTLRELHRLGEEMYELSGEKNCLRKGWSENGSYYAPEFLDGSMEFWGLYGPDGVVLAALRVDLEEDVPVAVEFNNVHNQLAEDYMDDFLHLNRKLKYSTADDVFLAYGIWDGQDIGTIDPVKLGSTKIYQSRSRILLKDPTMGECSFDLQWCTDLEDALEQVGRQWPRHIAWIGRCLARLKSKHPEDNDWELSDIIQLKGKYVYWRDAISGTKKIDGRKYILTSAGVTEDRISPLWIIETDDEDGMLLHGWHSDFPNEIEDTPQPLKFWKWLDPKAQYVSFLADIGVDEDGRPLLTSVPSREGWQNTQQGWTKAQYKAGCYEKTDTEVPKLTGKYGVVKLRERKVLDRGLEENEVCLFTNRITKKWQPYAFQMIATVDGDVEAGGTLRLISKLKSEFLLTAPGRHPEALAHLLNATGVGNSKFRKLAFGPDVEQRYKCMVKKGKEGFQPILGEEIVDGVGSWTTYYKTIIGYDEKGYVIWSAHRDTVELDSPLLWASKEVVVSHAIKVAHSFGAIFGDGWRPIFASQEYYLCNGAPLKAPKPESKKFHIRNRTDDARAVRKFETGLINFMITCSEGIKLRLAARDSESICELKYAEDSGETPDFIPYGARVLVHAILDKFGLTLVPADLRWLGLRRFRDGHKRQLGWETIPIRGCNLKWEPHKGHWVVKEEEETIAVYGNDLIGIKTTKCPEELYFPILSSMNQALAETYCDDELPESERRPWEERFREVRENGYAWQDEEDIFEPDDEEPESAHADRSSRQSMDWVSDIRGDFIAGMLIEEDISSHDREDLLFLVESMELGIDPAKLQSKGIPLLDAILVKMSLRPDDAGWFKGPDLRPLAERTDDELIDLSRGYAKAFQVTPEDAKDLGIGLRKFFSRYSDEDFVRLMLIIWAFRG